MYIRTITRRSDGEAMHLAPNGKEGYEYTAEEVYNMLQKNLVMNNSKLQSNGKTKNTTKRIDNHTKWQQI